MNAALSERSFKLENQVYLVTVGGEFGLTCSTQPQFSVAWFFGDSSVNGWSNCSLHKCQIMLRYIASNNIYIHVGI